MGSQIVFNSIILMLLILCPVIRSSNVLVVSLYMVKSHFYVGEAIATALADAGHQVTFVSPFDYTAKSSNIEAVELTGAIENSKWTKEFGIDDYTSIPREVAIPGLSYMGAILSNFTLSHPNVRALFSRKYDLVIVEAVATEALIGLGQQFDTPVICFSSYTTTRHINDLVGNPSPLSYIPHPLLGFSDKMNFWQRLYNTWVYICESAILTFYHHPSQRFIYNNIFPNAKLTYDEAIKDVALVFVNSHFSLASPLPYVPNVIEIGGIHVNNRHTKLLPHDIKDFIESAKDGVVYFSLGSFAKSASLQGEKRDAFINAFGKMKEKIIWKFEDETVLMPENVLRGSWFPQSDILGHPNVKAFISHGGMLSLTEAVFHGVPIVGVPIWADQHLNIKTATEAGWAITLDYANITTEAVEWAMSEILENTRYSKNAKIRSQMYRDQPMTPSETMVYWAEYIIRHKKTVQLRSTALDLNYIQYHNLDVFFALIAFVLVAIYGIKSIIFKLCCQKRSEKKIEKSSKKNR